MHCAYNQGSRELKLFLHIISTKKIAGHHLVFENSMIYLLPLGIMPPKWNKWVMFAAGNLERRPAVNGKSWYKTTIMGPTRHRPAHLAGPNCAGRARPSLCSTATCQPLGHLSARATAMSTTDFGWKRQLLETML